MLASNPALPIRAGEELLLIHSACAVYQAMSASWTTYRRAVVEDRIHAPAIGFDVEPGVIGRPMPAERVTLPQKKYASFGSLVDTLWPGALDTREPNKAYHPGFYPKQPSSSRLRAYVRIDL